MQDDNNTRISPLLWLIIIIVVMFAASLFFCGCTAAVPAAAVRYQQPGHIYTFLCYLAWGLAAILITDPILKRLFGKKTDHEQTD
jgi:hypothetical protein